jgi:hypothetical protein
MRRRASTTALHVSPCAVASIPWSYPDHVRSARHPSLEPSSDPLRPAERRIRCRILALAIVTASDFDIHQHPGDAIGMSIGPSLPSLLLVGTLDGRVSALETQTGDVLWSIDTGGGMVSSFQNDSSFGTIVPSLSGAIMVIGSESGVLQKLPVSAQSLVEQSPFMASDGSVYVGTKRSDVYLVDLVTGAVDQSFLSPARLGRGGAHAGPEGSVHPPVDLGGSEPDRVPFPRLLVGRQELSVGAFDPLSGCRPIPLRYRR